MHFVTPLSRTNVWRQVLSIAFNEDMIKSQLPDICWGISHPLQTHPREHGVLFRELQSQAAFWDHLEMVEIPRMPDLQWKVGLKSQRIKAKQRKKHALHTTSFSSAKLLFLFIP